MQHHLSPSRNGHATPTSGRRSPAGLPGMDAIEDVEGLAAELQATVASRLARLLPADRLLELSADDHAQVSATITEALASIERRRILAGAPALDPEGREQVCQQVFDALLRLGPLQRYLADPQVEELILNGHARGFVIGAGSHKHEIATGFGSEAELHAFAARTVATLGRRLDAASPAVDAALPDGSRLHVISPPLAPCTCVTIRRHRLAASSLAELVELGTLSPPVADLLASAVAAGLNLLISGGTASGKTTLLNALGAQIPPHERVLTIEQTKELQLDRHLRDCVTLEARLANTEGVGEVTQRDLLTHALRMRPDRIVLGEARGPEALDMLAAMNSGHDGSMSTLHASSARQALDKLAVLTMWAEAGLSVAVVDRLIGETIHWVIHLHLRPDGRRVLAEIVEVAGIEEARLLTNRLAALDAHGRPVLTGLRPQHADRLHAAGWDRSAGQGVWEAW